MPRTQKFADNELQFVIDTTAGGIWDQSYASPGAPNGQGYTSLAQGWTLTIPPAGGDPGSTVTLDAGQFPVNIPDGTIQSDLSLDRDGESQITFRVIWDDSVALTHYFLSCNNQVVYAGSGFGGGTKGYGIWRGWRHPLYVNQFCVGVSMKPAEPPTNALYFDYALLTLTFKSAPISGPFPLSIPNADFASVLNWRPTIEYEVDLQPSGEVITVPASEAAQGFTVHGTPTGEPETVFMQREASRTLAGQTLSGVRSAAAKKRWSNDKKAMQPDATDGRLYANGATPAPAPNTHTTPGGVTVAEKRTALKSADPPPGFVAFWSAWPSHHRKKGKSKCLRLWFRKELEPMADVIVSAVKWFTNSPDWRKNDGQFIPGPEPWLNDESWEVPQGTSPSPEDFDGTEPVPIRRYDRPEDRAELIEMAEAIHGKGWTPESGVPGLTGGNP